MKRLLCVALIVMGCVSIAPHDNLYAQPPAVTRAYTEERPLVYEDAWDLYPYSYLNDRGEPEGFNIDLIRLLMHELRIPYTIRLKHGSEAFEDLRDGKSDLMMGLAAGYHDEYGRYGQNAITLFTQSVATPKGKPVMIHNFRDLEKNRVIVNAGSLCYHLMKDYGWEDNAETTKDIHEALMQVSANEEGQVVWNDLSLKWVIRRYGIENLQVTPVNMPHGEYRFMSNDPELLQRLDEAYSRLHSSDRLTEIQNRWFYPDRTSNTLPEWVWWAVAALAVIIVVLLSYAISYRIQARRLSRDNSERHRKLTHIMEQQREAEDLALRFATVFNTPVMGMMLFDRDGYLIAVNDRSCEIFGAKREDVLAAHIPLNYVLGIGLNELDYRNVDGFSATQLINLDAIAAENRNVPQVHHRGWLCNEFSLLAVRDDAGELAGIIGFCKDTTDLREAAIQERQLAGTLDRERAVLGEYESDIALLLNEQDIRLVTYSPAEHALRVYDRTGEVRHTLTQTRCMAFVDNRSTRLVLRTLASMDEGLDREIDVSIATTLRIHHMPLHLRFCLMPECDTNGSVRQYYGICRDMSQLREIERLTAIEQAKLQDVEDTKSRFMKNMVQEIRRPMESIVADVARLDPLHVVPEEPAMLKDMLDNCHSLLHLIANILHLSRLQTHIVEITPCEVDFSPFFEAKCFEGWQKYRNVQTQYVVENPYEQLLVNIDPSNLGHVITQVTANAAQHTPHGSVRARYDYIGRRLLIAIDDTGEGIAPDLLQMANTPNAEIVPGATGLGLAITKEIISQMDGTIEISSEPGLGTTVYISIPCHATIIRRKRIS